MKHVLSTQLAVPLASPLATSSFNQSPRHCRLRLPSSTSHILAGATPGTRRNRSTVAVRAAQLENERKIGRKDKQTATLLRTIRGVGKVNESKLIQKGLDSLESLQDVYVNACGEDKEETIKYLRAEVGIRHKRHCESIVEYVQGLLQPGVTVCVEGNISAGKSTFLDIVRGNNDRLGQDLLVVPEPVDMWQNAHYGLDKKCLNLLNAYYQKPQETAYVFQTYVFLTRVFKEASTRVHPGRMRLMERSVFSDRMVFVRKLQADDMLNPEQLGVYDGVFRPLVASMSSLTPDGFIYLRAQPQTCMRRMKRRSRSEEAGVPQDYLEGLHANHEDWLLSTAPPSGAPPETPLWMDQDVNMTVAPLNRRLALRGNARQRQRPTPPDCIKADLKWVYAKPVPLVMEHLSEVPVLVLEMDQDLDLERDVEAKQHLSSKVDAYFTYVQDCKSVLNISREEERAVMANMNNPAAAIQDMKMRMMPHDSPRVGNMEQLVSSVASRNVTAPRPVASLPRQAYKYDDLVQQTNVLVRNMTKDHVVLLYSLLVEMEDSGQLPATSDSSVIKDLRSALAHSSAMVTAR